MDVKSVRVLGRRALARSHFLLVCHLLMLHVLAFGGWQVPAIRLLWLVALGLFLLWQPFVSGERPVSIRQGVLLFFVALLSTWFLGPWLLLVWCGAMAAVIGGRVLWTERRLERVGYLFAFGYLVGIVIFGAIPEISPALALDNALRDVFGHFMPVLLPLLLAFPVSPPQRRAGDVFDLFYGVLVFLVLAVFVLGALAYMLVGGVSYVESLFKTSLGLAGALLLVAWAWNPQAGFSGIGSAVSRYLLSVGMPIEQWLVHLSDVNEQESDPERFLACVMARLEGMAWVHGAKWQAAGAPGRFGEETNYPYRFQIEGVNLSVFFRFSPSLAMQWHVEWLLRLAAEFYLLKRQTHELQRMSYLQAVYETGARITHDVKNLLQSMQTLCYAAAQPGDAAQLAALLGRQLPQITERLRITLEKLQSPRVQGLDVVPAVDWWRGVRDRYAQSQVGWRAEVPEALMIPRELFDSVLENLLQNALAKRQRHDSMAIEIEFVAGKLKVSDDGPVISPAIAENLLKEPVRSENGLGIGLFHAARQAQSLGYRLSVTENRTGCVVFELAPVA